MIDNKNSNNGESVNIEGSALRRNGDSSAPSRYSPFSSLKKPLFQRKRFCPLSSMDDDLISYKNPILLKKYLSERGRILPTRLTSVSYKKQLKLSNAIKRARFLALIPYISNN